ncbi:hypothetical protein I6F65_20800 [Pseudoalteromonas sp. SWXJZ94C]|uniref:hypothetical protein n=1 Tax=Pseudoalteromonas sp. SWXJZ94C TaxID=2792065 RepID=UPI0018CDB342|nr:hypothetical protein [Pseudoalteromonas sp. SWXJZ94C]MBH0059383.1 hypothetical protein [Pseudoalteromonas sp. SWXJZ94C]
MLNKTKINKSIKNITSNEYYEGDFGDCIDEIDLLLDNIDESLWEGVPKSYIEFIAEFGFGDLDSTFYLDDGPVSYITIFKRDIEQYIGMYIFASNSSDILYAFDSLNNWIVVELSSEALDVTKVADSFEQFIVDKLEYIEELAELRLED